MSLFHVYLYCTFQVNTFGSNYRRQFHVDLFTEGIIFQYVKLISKIWFKRTSKFKELINILADFCSQRGSRASLSCFLQLFFAFFFLEKHFPSSQGSNERPINKRANIMRRVDTWSVDIRNKTQRAEFYQPTDEPAATDWNRTKDTAELWHCVTRKWTNTCMDVEVIM